MSRGKAFDKTHRIWTAAVVALALGAAAASAPMPPPPAMTVYKSPTCGCCRAWVDHMTRAGFRVTVHDTSTLDAVKATRHIPPQLQSCHTADVAGYVIEGHVPADLIERLVRERPAIAGLAVPGMPMGSPGMEGGRRDAYQVLTFDRSGRTTVYATR